MILGKSKIFFLIWFLFLIVSCKKLPYVADENAIIYLEANPSLIRCGESATIIITGVKGNGYPLPDETIVYLSVSTGNLASEVALNNGKAETAYQANNNFTGEVIITARSGKALVSPEQLVIIVSLSDVFYLYLTAEPPALPHGGGNTTITAQAMDDRMEPIEGKALWLETTAGVFSHSGTLVTNHEGKITSILTTEKEATVTVKYKELKQTVDILIEDANNPPTAAFVYSPTEPVSGETVYFNAEASTDVDGTIISFQWDLGDGAKKNGKTIKHVYQTEEQKVFFVTLKVTDNEGAEGVENQEITVRVPGKNENPTAAFVYSPTSPRSGEIVYFNAEQSSDPDGYIVVYEWNFGDGSIAQGKTINHTYEFQTGTTVNVTLKVTDDQGGIDVESQAITIETEENSNPVAAFDYSPKYPKSGEKIYFNAGSSYDPDGQIISFAWDFGDGSIGNGQTVNHSYSVKEDTTVKVILIITDDRGGKDVESKEITISADAENASPVAEFSYSPKTPRSEETIYFNAGGSYDPDGNIVSYRWDFGDGNTARGETVSHAYSVPETTTFVVTLKIIDDKGAEDVESKEITIHH